MRVIEEVTAFSVIGSLIGGERTEVCGGCNNDIQPDDFVVVIKDVPTEDGSAGPNAWLCKHCINSIAARMVTLRVKNGDL